MPFPNEDPLLTAVALYDTGCSLIPLRKPAKIFDKKPEGSVQDGKKPALPEWKKYEKERASPDDIYRWFEKGDANIGVVCGGVSGGLFVVDVDGTDLLAYIDSRTGASLESRTFAVRTGGGIHVYFRSGVPVESRKMQMQGAAFKDYPHIDIKAEGGYVVGPSSVHWSGKVYEALNEKQTQTVSDPEGLLGTLSDIAREYWVVRATAPFWQPHQRHNIGIGLPAFLKSRKWPKERAEAVVETLCRVGGEHADWRSDLESTYRKEDANFRKHLPEELVVLLAKILPAPKHEPVGEVELEETTFHREGSTVYEQVDARQFVKSDLETGEWEMVPSFVLRKEERSERGKTVEVTVLGVPLMTKHLETGQMLLAEKPVPAEGGHPLTDIVKEIEQKMPKWIHIDPKEMLAFMVQLRIAIASWFLFVFDDPHIMERAAGLNAVLGPSGSGKKRWATMMMSVAYRPIRILSTLKIPSIFRLAEPWKTPTLVIEEADQKLSDSTAEFIQFVNGRFDGIPISRYNSATGKNESLASFGLTCLVLRRGLEDEGATNRTTGMTSAPSPVPLPEIAGPDVYADFAEIRNRLLWLRLKYMSKLRFVGTSDLPIEDSWRVRESLVLFRLLEQIDPSIAPDLRTISKELTLREVASNANTFDGAILNELHDYMTGKDVEVKRYANRIYFCRTVVKGEGVEEKERTYPLSTHYLAQKFNIPDRVMLNDLKPFGITTDRLTVGGRQTKGILMFESIESITKFFRRYVVNCDTTQLNALSSVLQPIDNFHGADHKADKADKADMSCLPLKGVQGDLMILSLEEKEKNRNSSTISSTETGKNTHPVTQVAAALSGLPDLDPKKQISDQHEVTNVVETATENSPSLPDLGRVQAVIFDRLKGARGSEMEQPPAYILKWVAEQLGEVSMAMIRDALGQLKEAGKARERDGKWSAT